MILAFMLAFVAYWIGYMVGYVHRKRQETWEAKS
jgi:hypothetical protein